jgi:hypothetical protein
MPISRRRPPLPLRTSRKPRPWLTAHIELPVGPMSCVIDRPTRGRPWSSAAVRSELHRCCRTRPAVNPSWNAASALPGWATSIPSRVLLCAKSRRASGARRRNRFGRALGLCSDEANGSASLGVSGRCAEPRSVSSKASLPAAAFRVAASPGRGSLRRLSRALWYSSGVAQIVPALDWCERSMAWA